MRDALLKGSLHGSWHSGAGVRNQGGGVWGSLVELRPMGVWGKPMGRRSCQLNGIEADARSFNNLFKRKPILLSKSETQQQGSLLIHLAPT